MIVGDSIRRGLAYLQLVQNSDGGIPATRPGAPSGCWTSAETLESAMMALLHAEAIFKFASRLVAFLEKTQLASGDDAGAWPLVAGGTRGSTMATGHALSALQSTQRIVGTSDIAKRLAPIIEKGFLWLDRVRNPDGGWGVEPRGGADGQVSRVIATVYALRAYLAQGKTIETSAIVRDSVEFLLTCRNLDGGFGGQRGASSDACSSARVVSALVLSRYGQTTHRVIAKAMKFVRRARTKERVWQLDTETYVTEGAPGQTVYNSNTVADALEALLRGGDFGEAVAAGLHWYIRSQRDDGSWCLCAPGTKNEAVVTWPTNEAISVLVLSQRQLEKTRVPRLEARATYWRRISVALGLATAVAAIPYVHLPAWLSDWWSSLSDRTRDIMVTGIVIGLLVNLLAAFLYDVLGRWRRRHNDAS